MEQLFNGKRILVTGGTGSIGSEIVRALLPFSPKQIRVFSFDDTQQFELAQTLPSDAPVNFLIGDVRDKDRLMRAMEHVDIVFHAAALKHVGACERNPLEAVKTNVLGTQNVIDAALERGVDRVIVISTDKAAAPTSVMGVTKLLAEKLVLSSFFYKGDKTTKLCAVRFGNVLWSRGSVTPLFLSQLMAGKPLTVTDPKMLRFFMSIPEAVSLVFEATSLTQDREVFVLKMPTLRIADLAEAMIAAGKERGIIVKHPGVTVCGRRDGERLNEQLLTADEAEEALETDELFILQPHVGFSLAHPKKKEYPGGRKARQGAYTTTEQIPLSVEEIKQLLLRTWPQHQ